MIRRRHGPGRAINLQTVVGPMKSPALRATLGDHCAVNSLRSPLHERYSPGLLCFFTFATRSEVRGTLGGLISSIFAIFTGSILVSSEKQLRNYRGRITKGMCMYKISSSGKRTCVLVLITENKRNRKNANFLAKSGAVLIKPCRVPSSASRNVTRPIKTYRGK